ncbi:uncharacterized protein TNCV_836081 [Trichonephila clavipes]|nr:uncharacterized protein TNCV_836081 [Trichonephila clavipes]
MLLEEEEERGQEKQEGSKVRGGPTTKEKVHYVEVDLSSSMAFSVSMEMREQQERLKSSQTKHLNSSRLPPSRDFRGYRMGCRVAPHQLSPGWEMVAASTVQGNFLAKILTRSVSLFLMMRRILK